MVKELRKQFEGLLDILDGEKLFLSMDGHTKILLAMENFHSNAYEMDNELWYTFFDDNADEYSREIRIMDKDIEDIKIIEYENVGESDEDEKLHFVLNMIGNSSLHMVVES